jgi:hypothetical protein
MLPCYCRICYSQHETRESHLCVHRCVSLLYLSYLRPVLTLHNGTRNAEERARRHTTVGQLSRQTLITVVIHHQDANLANKPCFSLGPIVCTPSQFW